MYRQRAFCFSMALVVLGWLAQPLAAQNAYVLHLGSEGSATVVLAERDHVAYITDGGRARDGITDAAIDGRRVLQLLQDRDIRYLVITCSHPHADHLNGLVALVTHPDFARLPLERLYFVDAGLEGTGGDERSLYRRYQAHWATKKAQALLREPGRRLPNTMRVDATNRDAFGAIEVPREVVTAQNFVYAPREGAGAHGRAVLVTYTLRQGTQVRRFADLDDADGELVARWAEYVAADSAARQPYAIIMPHHGTRPDLTDPRPLFRTGVRPRVVIFTVNEGNSYRHPDPETVALCLAELGRDNVFFTTDPNNVRITAAGVERDESTVPLRPFLDGLRAQREEVGAETDALREQAASRPLTEGERRTLERNQRWLGWWDRVERRWGRDDDGGLIAGFSPKRPWDGSPWDKGPRLPGPDLVPPNPSKSGPVEVGKGLLPPESGLPPSGRTVQPNPPKSGPGLRLDLPPNTGNFRDMTVRNQAAVRRAGPAIAPGIAPVQRMRLFRPRVGGVIVGNTVEAPGLTVRKAELVTERNADGNEFLALRVTVRNEAGTETAALYREFTPTELWCAAQFILPPADVRAKYQLADQEAALVGIDKNIEVSERQPTGTGGIWQRRPIGWEFNINPAIANTPLARDAMRLDMSLVHPFSTNLVGKIPSFVTYQWYDAAARITLRAGRIRVEAADGPPEMLLRLRLWEAVLPPWAEGQASPDRAVQAEMQKRLQARRSAVKEVPSRQELKDAQKARDLRLLAEFDAAAEDIAAERAGKGRSSRAELLTRTADRLAKYAAREGNAFADSPAARLEIGTLTLAAALAAEGYSPAASRDELPVRFAAYAKKLGLDESAAYRERVWRWEIEAQLEEELGRFVEVDPRRLAALPGAFAPARRLDRFARAVAVLRWVQRDTQALPNLSALAPVRLDVRPMFLFTDVFAEP